MAQPIAFASRTSQTARRADLVRNVASKHAEAILSAYELLELLHNRGVLSFLRGLIGSGAEVMELVTRTFDQPAVIRVMRNLLLFCKFVAALPPDAVASLAETVKEGIKWEEQHNAPSVIRLLARLRNEDSRHALSLLLDLFENLGKEL